MLVLFIMLILLCILCQRAGAQSSAPLGEISGRVVDAADQESLAHATVEVRLQADSSLVTGAITDEEGRFHVQELSTGQYFLRVGFVGYVNHTVNDIELSAADPIRSVGTVELVEDSSHLDGVEVTEERAHVETQIDRTVYNVADSPMNTGGSARDALTSLPSIEVDIEGEISYRGNANVAIHIDGRPSALSGQALSNFLQGLPADAIARVEMIPTPSARHEPDGMAGIVNIVMAETQTGGWSGGITVGAGTRPSYNASPTISYQSDRWTFTTNYGFRYNTHDFNRLRLRERHIDSPTSILEHDTFEDHLHVSHALSTDLEFRPTQATSIGASTSLTFRDDKIENRIHIGEGIPGEDLDQTVRYALEDRDPWGIDSRLTLNQVINGDEDHTLDAQLRFQQNEDSREGTYDYFSLSEEGTPGEQFSEELETYTQHTRRGIAELDYERSVSGVDIETGYHGSWRRIESDRRSIASLPGPSASELSHKNIFQHDQHLHALYGILSRELGSFGVKTGIRVEQAWTSFEQEVTDERHSNNYFSLFPSAYLTYEWDEARQLQLSYSKRVQRPSMWHLNPIDTSTDPSFRRVGNPAIEPAYTHSFELGLTQHWDVLTLRATPFFRRTVNQISGFETLDEDGNTALTFDNFSARNSYGAEFVATPQVGQHFHGNISVNMHRRITDGGNIDSNLNNETFAINAQANLTANLRSGLSLQWTQRYRAPMDIAGGRVDGQMISNVALQQEILQGRGSISLRATDLFDTMESEFWRDMDSFYQQTNHSMNVRALSVAFQYTLGSREQETSPADPGGGLPDAGTQ